MTRQAIAESLLGEIRWEDASTGFCRCPGIDLHSNDNAPKDCIIHIDGAPNVYCVHSSCKAIIDETSHKLQSEFGSAERGETGSRQRWQPSRADLERKAKAERAEKLRKAADEMRPAILKDHAIEPAELWRQSPTSLVGILDRDLWRHLLRLFKPQDVVWIGDKRESGPGHEGNFRTVSKWLMLPECPGPRICPSTFQPGTNKRSKDTIIDHRFMVFESDTLSIRNQCALIMFLRRFCRLRAVVSTGNRSLHAWFDCPSGGKLEELKAIKDAMQIDKAGFNPSQPYRLPCVLHETSGRYSDLTFLDLEGAP